MITARELAAQERARREDPARAAKEDAERKEEGLRQAAAKRILRQKEADERAKAVEAKLNAADADAEVQRSREREAKKAAKAAPEAAASADEAGE